LASVDLVEFLAWLVFLLVEKMVATTRKKRRKLNTMRRRTGRWKSSAGRPPLRDTKHSPKKKQNKNSERGMRKERTIARSREKRNYHR
jgi:hypothetical protein